MVKEKFINSEKNECYNHSCCGIGKIVQEELLDLQEVG